jgi:hypothetical protein
LQENGMMAESLLKTASAYRAGGGAFDSVEGEVGQLHVGNRQPSSADYQKHQPGLVWLDAAPSSSAPRAWIALGERLRGELQREAAGRAAKVLIECWRKASNTVRPHSSLQDYVEDCPVCCHPMALHVDRDPDGEARVRGEHE